jgi:hypothetical protein
MTNCRDLMPFAAAALLASSGVMAQSAVPTSADCIGVTDIKSKSRQLFEGKTLMTSLLMLEQQGEKEFKPSYSPPASECVLERFAVAAGAVTTVYSPFEKGEHTLHYRFTATNDTGTREVLVLYDGLASLMAKKGPIFFVVENRAGNISYYAMFREQPTYAALKPLIATILDGAAQPLATVRWPPGAKEPVIDAYDTKRLK